jgi:opacity protein-like surface antigen
MKKMIKTTVVLAAVIIMTKSSMAQKGLEVNLSYNIATPVGSAFRDVIRKTSFSSFQGSVLYGITDHFKLGVQTSYTHFHHKVSTGFDNIVNSVPLLAKAEYSFLMKGFVKPFIGLGAGIDFINYDPTRGGFGDHNHYSKAAFTGDAGVLIPFTKNGKHGIRISTSYNLMPFKEENIKNLDSWNVQAGVSIQLGK